ELEAELEMRKKQYTYYREKLLTPKDNWQMKTLGEVGQFVRGSGLPKSDFTESGVPAIHYGQIYTYYGVYTEKTISFVSEATAEKLKKVNYGDVVITNTSENLEDVGKAVVYLGKEQAVTGGHASIFKPSKDILGKYFAYFTQTNNFSEQKRKYAKGIKVIDVSAKDLTKIKIPLPPLEEQERIVKILDKFDTLVNSISEGLPKEIELRRKQYEYYREQLLSF
ncbi:MAG: restriction endonuclease subunit S, partial [Bergeyella zoohelcum]|nr:restriction endonuclease subunit S [Bergeyella zoohelcum]